MAKLKVNRFYDAIILEIFLKLKENLIHDVMYCLGMRHGTTALYHLIHYQALLLERAQMP